MKRLIVLLAMLAIAAPAAATAASVVVTIEDAGVQSADLAGIGATGAIVETFDGGPTGLFTEYDSELGTYSAVNVGAANQYGGADESQYLFVQGTPGSTLTLDTPATYLGFWWSAGSGSNTVELKSEGSTIFTFDTTDVVDFINTNAQDPSAYYGNPNPGFLGRVSHEPYAFINMFAEMVFDTVVFSGGNFESDNHTVAETFNDYHGYEISAPTPPAVPLPAPFLLLTGGMAALAFVTKRRRPA